MSISLSLSPSHTHTHTRTHARTHTYTHTHLHIYFKLIKLVMIKHQLSDICHVRHDLLRISDCSHFHHIIVNIDVATCHITELISAEVLKCIK